MSAATHAHGAHTDAAPGREIEANLVGTVTEKPSWWVAFLLLPIRFYQRYVSALLGQNCKYFPSCSSYAVQALTRHGLIKGTLLAVWRLLRCNPWSRGGSDRVPQPGRWKPDPYVAPVFTDEASTRTTVSRE